MATSGSLTKTVTSWDNLLFEWSAPVANQSTTNNTSTVTWSLKLVAGSSGRISSSVAKSWSVTVNGTKYSGTNYVNISNNQTKVLASGSTVVKHNADGTKTFSYSFSQEFGITFSGNYIGTISGSSTGTLNTIDTGGTSIDTEPQLPVIPFRVDSISKTDIKDIDTSFTVYFTNTIGGAKDSLKVCIAKTDGSTIVVPYKEIDKTSTQYTFYISDIRHQLAAAMPDTLKQSFRVYFMLTEDGYNDYYYITFRYTIGSDMTISYHAYDVNSTTVALTNSRNTFIPGYSDVRLAIEPLFAYEGEVSSFYIEYNNGKRRLTVSLENTVDDIVESSINFYAKSKRGTTRQVTAQRTIFTGYYKPTITMIPNHPNLDDAINLKIKGIGFTGKFGDVGVNNPFTVQTRYKVNNGAYTEWKTQNVSLSWNDGEYTGDIYNIATATYKDTYTVQARIIDGLETIEADPRSVIGATVFDWGRDDFSFNVPVNFPAGASYGIKALANDGVEKWVLQTSNDNNNTVLGWGNYDKAEGDTNIYGNNINLTSNNNITVDSGNRVFITAPDALYTHTPVFLLNDTDNNVAYDLVKLCRAMENSYLFDATATPGANYNSCSGDVRLCGTSLRVYFYGNRKSAPSTGDVANEEVMTLQFNHGGKIKNIYASGFTNATVGGVTSFSCSGEKVSDTVLKIKITLAATTTTGTAYDGFFWVPCVLNINNF